MTEVVETAVSTDAEGLVTLWEACGLTRPWNDPRADIAKALDTATSAILVLRRGTALVASAMVGFDGHRGWVYYLAVAPDAQGRGHGRHMMQACEDWLRDRGSPKIQFMVRDDNGAALGFYERLGYERQPVVTLGRRLNGTRA